MFSKTMNPKISIEKAGLNKEEIQKLVAEMKESPGFTGATVKEYVKYNKEGSLIALRINKEVAGIAAYKYFGGYWAEFTTLIVLTKFRGRKLGRKLYQEMMQKLEGKNIFVITANPIVKKSMMSADGFEKKSFRHLPGAVKRYLILQKISWTKIKGLLSRQSSPIRDFDFFIKKTHVQ